MKKLMLTLIFSAATSQAGLFGAKESVIMDNVRFYRVDSSKKIEFGQLRGEVLEWTNKRLIIYHPYLLTTDSYGKFGQKASVVSRSLTELCNELGYRFGSKLGGIQPSTGPIAFWEPSRGAFEVFEYSSGRMGSLGCSNDEPIQGISGE